MFAEVAVELFDGGEGLGANVVFHPFDIAGDNVFGQAEVAEKIGEQLMAVHDARGDRFAGVGEHHAAVFFVFNEAFAVEALHHCGDAGLGDFQLGGDIHHARVTLGLNEFAYAFEVVLDGR